MAIAVDAMGGDLAPRVNVEGAVAAADELGLDTLLVGRRRELEAELKKIGYRGSRVDVVEAEGKGTDATKEVFGLLKESGLNFAGNCEGRDVYAGDFDVIVTDGFTGNVILKVSESLAHLVEEALKQEITRSLQASMGFLLS